MRDYKTIWFTKGDLRADNSCYFGKDFSNFSLYDGELSLKAQYVHRAED
jgi:hypothetical protein